MINGNAVAHCSTNNYYLIEILVYLSDDYEKKVFNKPNMIEMNL